MGIFWEEFGRKFCRTEISEDLYPSPGTPQSWGWHFLSKRRNSPSHMIHKVTMRATRGCRRHVTLLNHSALPSVNPRAHSRSSFCKEATSGTSYLCDTQKH